MCKKAMRIAADWWLQSVHYAMQWQSAVRHEVTTWSHKVMSMTCDSGSRSRETFTDEPRCWLAAAVEEVEWDSASIVREVQVVMYEKFR